MNSKTKIVLTLIGLSALIVPVVLVVISPSKTGSEAGSVNGPRQIRQDEVQKQLENNTIKNQGTLVPPSPSPVIKLPSPSPKTNPSPSPPLESTTSSSVN